MEASLLKSYFPVKRVFFWRKDLWVVTHFQEACKQAICGAKILEKNLWWSNIFLYFKRYNWTVAVLYQDVSGLNLASHGWSQKCIPRPKTSEKCMVFQKELKFYTFYPKHNSFILVNFQLWHYLHQFLKSQKSTFFP